MAVVTTVVDSWIQNLLFSEPRDIAGQLTDGLWYGNLGVDGDASGGNVSLLGQVSFDRKEDWVYQLTHWGINRNVTAAVRWDLGFSTGPLIVAGGVALDNPFFFFNDVGTAGVVLGGLVGSAQNALKDLFLFGDKRIAGDMAFVTARCNTNTNTIAYQVSLAGRLFRYNDFFRQQSAFTRVREDAGRLRGLR